MGEIVKFPEPKPTELEKAAKDIKDRLEYLVDGLDHINLSGGILLIGKDGSSTDIRFSNQTEGEKEESYKPGENPELNEILNRNKIPEKEDK